jgi:hypothetical protein
VSSISEHVDQHEELLGDHESRIEALEEANDEVTATVI